MTAAWVQPQAEDVKAYMATVVVDRATDNDNVQKILAVVIKRVRGIVGRCNTVSEDDTEVPPEALEHVIYLTLSALLTGTPNFSFLMRGPDGSESGFGYRVKQAERWLTEVQNGLSVTYPTNPADTYPELVRSGSDNDEVDTTAA
jgi:hypothetical protein